MVAEALFERVTAAELDFFQFDEADYAPVDVWPENHDAVDVFRRVATQWRVSMAGATSLDYAAVYPLIERKAKGDEERFYELLDDIAVMENAALETMRRKDE